jgi:SAM-dependent methyltransferase
LARARADVPEWPSDGLEAVPSCPVCAGEHRQVLYEGLTDRIFFTAPGRWTLHRCADCGSVFLDPRPDRATIGLAYANYYTHAEGPAARPPRAERVRDAIRNGYLNARYGYELAPASRLGPVIAALLPKRRWYADHLVRHLEREPGRNRLLDVGCGDGAFLAGMQDAGWQVQGLEPDAAAAERARRSGVPVVDAPLEQAPFAPASFDAVTLQHVVEHFHDPLEALRICRRLLRPGGTLWLATPNLDARGHAAFGRDWLGLDPPRHLVLFTRSSLAGAVERAGFAVRAFPTAYMASPSFPVSAAIAAGRDPSEPAPDLRMRGRVLAADVLVRHVPKRAEEIVLIAEAV